MAVGLYTTFQAVFESPQTFREDFQGHNVYRSERQSEKVAGLFGSTEHLHMQPFKIIHTVNKNNNGDHKISILHNKRPIPYVFSNVRIVSPNISPSNCK